MNKYTYKNVNWKVFGIINDGTVLNKLKVKEDYRSNLYSFLHNSLGIMNYTSKNGQIFYEIVENKKGYSMKIEWTSTKLKSETTLFFLQSLKSNIEIPDVKTNWRNAIKNYLINLDKDCSELSYEFIKTESKEFIAKLNCKIDFKSLYSIPKEEDIPSEDFDYDKKDFSVPYELIESVVIENYDEALKYFGSDHQKLTDTLKPFVGKEYFADFLIGASYYLHLDLPNKAYAHFQRALNILKGQENFAPPLLLNFMGEIEMSVKNNPEKAEEHFVKSLLVGNEQGFLKLAYLYLQQADNYKKETALALVGMGNEILPFDEDLEHQIAGYHIVASVLLWNKEYNKAEKAHKYFLSNQEWCEKYPSLVKAYLILAIAYDNKEFITNIITDFVYLTKIYPSFFDVWHFDIINPFENKFKGEFIETLQFLELTKKLYEIK